MFVWEQGWLILLLLAFENAGEAREKPVL